ncbi:ribosome-binding factor A, partial [Mesorhizobium sp. M1E.F.Ca.ET.063.01.1.1]|uniref:ribosome-binding factor A n=1 Tax=Mesorhizobium sp. M1E.F.Ca.ET.063.01.1.1 TaxID=2496750 RepID=UPI000FD3FBF9
VSVSEVRMSPDLKIATAFVSPLGTGVAGALRQMKYMPEVRFRLDTSFDNFARINELLKSPEVARDLDDQNKDKDEE